MIVNQSEADKKFCKFFLSKLMEAGLVGIFEDSNNWTLEEIDHFLAFQKKPNFKYENSKVLNINGDN